MELTEEQRERIRRNRERALKLQQEHKKHRIEADSSSTTDGETSLGTGKLDGKELQQHLSETGKRQKINAQEINDTCHSSEIRLQNGKDFPTDNIIGDDKYKNDEIELFEEGASEYVTKQEAMKVYCLPLGTLEVCSYVEKPNPKNNSWQSMKLYYRNEIRHRAHARYGGITGLMEERNKRNQLRLQKDIEKSKDIFKN
jgi:hypothetical protein